MNVQAIKGDNEHYLLSVSCKDGLLTWKTNLYDEAYVLIVKSDFGRELMPERDFLDDLRKLSRFQEGKETVLSGGMTVFLYKRVNIIGYSCPQRPARYTLYICSYSGDDNSLTLYTDGLYKDVASQIRLRLSVKEVKYGHWWNPKKKTVVCITLSDGIMPVGYIDGALYYSFAGMKYRYPITGKMLKNGFKVDSYNGMKPVVESNSMGFVGILLNEV